MIVLPSVGVVIVVEVVVVVVVGAVGEVLVICRKKMEQIICDCYESYRNMKEL